MLLFFVFFIFTLLCGTSKGFMDRPWHHKKCENENLGLLSHFIRNRDVKHWIYKRTSKQQFMFFDFGSTNVGTAQLIFTSLTPFWCYYCKPSTYFTPFYCWFKRVHVSWAIQHLLVQSHYAKCVKYAQVNKEFEPICQFWTDFTHCAGISIVDGGGC